MSRLETTRSTFFDEDWHEGRDGSAQAPTERRRPRRRIRRISRRIRPGRRGRAALTLCALAATAVAVVLPSQNADADPSSHTWYRLRMCESGDRYSINTGNGYYGAYQFDLGTWRSVGGAGYPNRASKAEQDARALILYRERGWQPWTCAGLLGLREDNDARSGRTNDISIASPRPRATTRPTAAAAIPAFPAKHWYYPGADNRHIKTFQDAMHRRGYFPVGTGQYGPNTLHMVKRLQKLNGLVPNGAIGPNTWRLAWIGKY